MGSPMPLRGVKHQLRVRKTDVDRVVGKYAVEGERLCGLLIFVVLVVVTVAVFVGVVVDHGRILLVLVVVIVARDGDRRRVGGIVLRTRDRSDRDDRADREHADYHQHKVDVALEEGGDFARGPALLSFSFHKYLRNVWLSPELLCIVDRCRAFIPICPETAPPLPAAPRKAALQTFSCPPPSRTIVDSLRCVYTIDLQCAL